MTSSLSQHFTMSVKWTHTTHTLTLTKAHTQRYTFHLWHKIFKPGALTNWWINKSAQAQSNKLYILECLHPPGPETKYALVIFPTLYVHTTHICISCIYLVLITDQQPESSSVGEASKQRIIAGMFLPVHKIVTWGRAEWINETSEGSALTLDSVYFAWSIPVTDLLAAWLWEAASVPPAESLT